MERRITKEHVTMGAQHVWTEMGIWEEREEDMEEGGYGSPYIDGNEMRPSGWIL